MDFCKDFVGGIAAEWNKEVIMFVLEANHAHLVSGGDEQAPIHQTTWWGYMDSCMKYLSPSWEMGLAATLGGFIPVLGPFVAGAAVAYELGTVSVCSIGSIQTLQ